MVRESSVDRLVRESEQLREDLLRMAGKVAAWKEDLIQESAHLREESSEGMTDDGAGSGEAGPADPGGPVAGG